MAAQAPKILIIEGLHPFYDDRVNDLVDFRIYLDISGGWRTPPRQSTHACRAPITPLAWRRSQRPPLLRGIAWL